MNRSRSQDYFSIQNSPLQSPSIQNPNISEIIMPHPSGITSLQNPTPHISVLDVNSNGYNSSILESSEEFGGIQSSSNQYSTLQKGSNIITLKSSPASLPIISPFLPHQNKKNSLMNRNSSSSSLVNLTSGVVGLNSHNTTFMNIKESEIIHENGKTIAIEIYDSHNKNVFNQNESNSNDPNLNGSHHSHMDEYDDDDSHYLFQSERKVLFAITFAVSLVLLFILNQHGLAFFLTSFLSWVKSIGIYGNFMFVLMFILISFPVILGGYTPLTLGAGAIYGVVVGTVTVSISSTIGACIAFWVCRFFTRAWVESKIHGKEEFEVFMAMFVKAKENKLVSILARLSPIPFGLQNSIFAITDISFRDFFFSTWLGLLPFQILWTHFGTTLRNLSKITSGEVELDFWQKISLFVQLVVAFALGFYFYFMTKKFKAEQRVNKQLLAMNGTGIQSTLPMSNQL